MAFIRPEKRREKANKKTRKKEVEVHERSFESFSRDGNGWKMSVIRGGGVVTETLLKPEIKGDDDDGD